MSRGKEDTTMTKQSEDKGGLFCYLEIVNYKTGEVSKRIDVTDKSDRQIDKIDRAMNINLNHQEWYTTTTEYFEKQETF